MTPPPGFVADAKFNTHTFLFSQEYKAAASIVRLPLTITFAFFLLVKSKSKGRFFFHERILHCEWIFLCFQQGTHLIYICALYLQRIQCSLPISVSSSIKIASFSGIKRKHPWKTNEKMSYVISRRIKCQKTKDTLNCIQSLY